MVKLAGPLYFEVIMNPQVKYSAAESIIPQPIESIINKSRKLLSKSKSRDEFASAREAYQQGLNHALSGNWQKAVKDFRRAANQSPLPEIYYSLGLAYYMVDELNRAASTFEKVIKLAPQDAEAYLCLGALYIGLGKPNKALKPLRKVIQLNGDKAEAYLCLGFVHSQLCHWQLAEESFVEAIKIKKDYISSYLHLAKLYTHLAQCDETEREHYFHKALSVYERLLEVDPSNPAAVQNIQSIKEAQLERRLFELGLLKKIRKPITDLTPYENRRLIEVKGKPLSETIIEERR
jgi:tetratricopeptide (TPR) repeat protein